MLSILEAGREELTTLNHGPDVFYDALAKVREAGMHSASLERVE